MPTPRILFLSDHLGHPEGRVHGATTYFLNTLPPLRDSGLDLTVCFLRSRHPSAGRLEALGITPIFLARSKWDIRALGDLSRLIRQHRIQLVHAAGMKGILLGRIAARKARLPFIAHLHDTNPLDPLTRFLQRTTASWTHAAIGISKTVCDYATHTLAIPPERVHLLYNSLPLDPYLPPPDSVLTSLRADLGLDPQDHVIGCIGRLSEEKGHAPLLEALQPTLHNRAHLKLLLIGDGPLRPNLTSLVQKLNLQTSVHFLGHRDDVPALLHLMNALVIPSLREGLGYIALEAMAAGTPVAAFATGGLAETIQHDHNGLLAPPGQTNTLITNLLRLLDDAPLAERLIAAGHAYVQSYSLNHHIAHLRAIYNNLTKP
ncbi:MAG TPA: glycosyltransferase family 4 protein [Kiritimatiellia bacterium]|nr:glycosyltransferase family 4 protein [Kiritimatiellia bacterium]